MNLKDIYLPHNISNNNVCVLFLVGRNFSVCTHLRKPQHIQFSIITCKNNHAKNKPQRKLVCKICIQGFFMTMLSLKQVESNFDKKCLSNKVVLGLISFLIV